MQLIDTHTHLTGKQYRGKLDAVLANARQAGIETWITVGTDLQDSAAAVALAGDHDHMYCTVGVHPHEAAKVESDYLDSLTELASNKNVRAIGEIGLDYHYDFSDRQSQKKVFAQQLKLAAELQLPIVVHCREAFDDCLAILDDCRQADTKLVFHCFSGNRQETDAVLERGFFISFTGTITFAKAAEVQEVAQYAPIERVFLETDCPYLSPEPKRNIRPNEPALLVHIAAKLAQLKQLTIEEIAQTTTQNCRSFFMI